MAIEPIDRQALITVHGGFDLGGGGGLDLSNVHGGPSQPTDGIACTPGDPLGQRSRHYASAAPEGGHGTGHGGGHSPHLEMPIDPYQVGPNRTQINRVGPRIAGGRSDRRLKRRIRSL